MDIAIFILVEFLDDGWGRIETSPKRLKEIL